MPPLPPDILSAPSFPAGAIYGLGTFDGVHRGHAHLIEQVIALGAELGLPACVLVMYRDPSNPLFAGQQVITTEPERRRLFARTALDAAGTLRLVPTITNMAHDAFVRDILLDQLRARHLVVGWDFHYGHARVGNVTLLRDQLAVDAPDCGLTVLKPVMDGAEPIKSTTIRQWLLAGEIEQANRWLAVPYFMLGTVDRGQQLGRTIGIPTANLAIPPTKLFPANAVYVTRADLSGQRYWAATNVGVRPTVNGDSARVTVESHLLDYMGEEFYGAELSLSFLYRIRGEQKFKGLDALQQQVAQDIAAVRDYAHKST